MAADERVFNMIASARKQLQKSGFSQSRAFLELFTEKDSIPTELLEVFYNANFRNGAIEMLEYKSGRITIAPVEGSYFMSLSTTKVLQSFNPLDPFGFPESVFSIKRKEMIEAYDFKLLEFNSGEVSVFFDAKPAFKNDYFSGSFSLDGKGVLEEIEFSVADPVKTPYVPLIAVDSLRPEVLDLKWIYTQTEKGLVPKLFDFDYRYISAIPLGPNYTAPWLERQIVTDGIVYFYDFDAPFLSPQIVYDFEFNDYQKMLNTPLHEAIWEIDRPLVETDRYRRSQEFIAENGTVKNYTKRAEYKNHGGLQSLFDLTNVYWSDTSRLRLNLIHHDPGDQKRYCAAPRRSKIKLDVEIYFDVVESDSILSHFSKCVFDIYNSYYGLESDSLTDLFLNLHFDLCEVERRQLEGAIASLDDITPDALLKLHDQSRSRLRQTHEQFFRETNSGESLRPLERYNKTLMEITGANNLELFLPADPPPIR